MKKPTNKPLFKNQRPLGFYQGLSKKELIFLSLRIVALGCLLAGVLWSRYKLNKKTATKKTLLERKARFIPSSMPSPK